MILVALIAGCSPAPSAAPSEPAPDDFTDVAFGLRVYGCTPSNPLCATNHYGVGENGLDLIFSGGPIFLPQGVEIVAGSVVPSGVTGWGSLYRVRPNDPLAAGLDGIGCTQPTVCVVYVEGPTLTVWNPEIDAFFSLAIDND